MDGCLDFSLGLDRFSVSLWMSSWGLLFNILYSNRRAFFRRAQEEVRELGSVTLENGALQCSTYKSLLFFWAVCRLYLYFYSLAIQERFIESCATCLHFTPIRYHIVCVTCYFLCLFWLMYSVCLLWERQVPSRSKSSSLAADLLQRLKQVVFIFLVFDCSCHSRKKYC